MVAALLLWVCASCADKPKEKDCQKLLDHVVDLEVLDTSDKESITKEVRQEIEKQKKELRDYMRKDFIKTCREKLAVSFVECGLKARNKSKFTACMRKN